MKQIDVLTLFPHIFESFLQDIPVSRMESKGIGRINVVNIRSFADDKHQITDDVPYGGGGGMVLKALPIFEAIEAVGLRGGQSEVILMSPQGRVLDQARAVDLAHKDQLIFICGRYEGIDERVKALATSELSIGDYVLTNGELPSMVAINAIIRLYPGVVGRQESVYNDSFYDEGILDYPQYTRPPSYRDLKVPEVLLSGNHEEIRKWRRKQSLRLTVERRPELLERATLSSEDKLLLKEIDLERGKREQT